MATQEHNTTSDPIDAADVLGEAKGLIDILRSAVHDAPNWTDVTVYGAQTIIEEIHKRIERTEVLIGGGAS
ncbi:hypothetical protein EVC37_25605 [Methylocaldum sp. BRCS4]|nr:hypothetical protein [Methylocaldum sp. BRCS4]